MFWILTKSLARRADSQPNLRSSHRNAQDCRESTTFTRSGPSKHPCVICVFACKIQIKQPANKQAAPKCAKSVFCMQNTNQAIKDPSVEQRAVFEAGIFQWNFRCFMFPVSLRRSGPSGRPGVICVFCMLNTRAGRSGRLMTPYDAGLASCLFNTKLSSTKC